MKRITITGGSLNGNSGAEAMLATTISRIGEVYPDTIFGIFSPYYKDDQVIWKQNNNRIFLFNSSPLNLTFILIPLSFLAGFFRFLHLHRVRNLLPKSLKFLWQSDLLIDIAGVSFIDSRLKYLLFNVLSIYPAFLFRIPVIKFAQALGPFNNKINRLLATHCLNKCEHVFARGETTLNHLKKISLPKTKYSLAPDIVFCNKPGDSILPSDKKVDDFINEIIMNSRNKKSIIGICPSSVIESLWKKKRMNYIEYLETLIQKLIDKGYYIVIFPNATKQHLKYKRRNNDLPLIKDLQDRLDNKTESSQYSFFNKNLTSDGVKSIILNIDICILSRFHAMIFALILLKPLVVLGWSHKYMEVMKVFHFEELAFDCLNQDIEKIVEKVEYLDKNKNQLIQNIRQKIDSMKDLAYKQIIFTKKLLVN